MQNQVVGDIYLITNRINGKMYVGQTRCANGGYIGRWKDHLYVARRSETAPWYIDRAIQKHGDENFSIELLERVRFSDVDICAEWMDEREMFYIKLYNTRENGYNLTDGGKGNKNWEVPSDTVDKIRERMKTQPPPSRLGKKHSKETREKISLSLIKLFSDEARKTEIIAKALATKKANDSFGKKTTAIFKYDANGIFVKSYDSIKNASLSTGIHASSISRSCQRNHKLHGFYFRYQKDFNGLDSSSIKIKKFYGAKAKPVDQFSIDGVFIQTHPSAVEAGKSVGARGKKISACLAGEYKTYHGYIWKFHNSNNK